jgi:hypothetical protein
MNFKFKAKMKLVILILSSLSFNFSCFNTPVKMNDKKNNDTLQRPAYMTQQATLLNYGSDVEPIMVWADYIGTLSKEGKKYPHIHGVQYYYVKADKRDTAYYENVELRSGAKKINFKNVKILEQPIGGANIGFFDGKDSLWLFYVIENDEFKAEHKGVEYRRPPTIYLDKFKEYVSDDDIRVNIKSDGNDKYRVTFIDNGIVAAPYKLHGNCKGELETISFVNKENGCIYFISQDCYLEPINRDDLKKLQEFK